MESDLYTTTATLTSYMKAQNMKICAKNGKKISKIPYLSQKGQHVNIGIPTMNFEEL
jgi:hypothetical protein